MIAEDGGTVIPFPSTRIIGNGYALVPQTAPGQVSFDKDEFMRIIGLYGRMVVAGECRDYAMDFSKDAATFSAFRRAAEGASTRIEKRPALRNKQGMWTLYGEKGQVLKRGHELAGVLAVIERRLLKAV